MIGSISKTMKALLTRMSNAESPVHLTKREITRAMRMLEKNLVNGEGHVQDYAMACLAFIVQQNFEKFAPNQILVVAIAIAIATCGERVMEEMIVWVDDNKGKQVLTGYDKKVINNFCKDRIILFFVILLAMTEESYSSIKPILHHLETLKNFRIVMGGDPYTNQYLLVVKTLLATLSFDILQPATCNILGELTVLSLTTTLFWPYAWRPILKQELLNMLLATNSVKAKGALRIVYHVAEMYHSGVEPLTLKGFLNDMCLPALTWSREDSENTKIVNKMIKCQLECFSDGRALRKLEKMVKELKRRPRLLESLLQKVPLMCQIA